MRLFVAIVPPDEALAALAAAIAAARAAAPPEVRWGAPERWHLTLAFLGEVPDARVDRVREALAATVAERSVPALRIAGGGTFDRRVVWAGVEPVAEPADALPRLARAVARTARASGVPVERRPFRPHVTLARVRPAAGPAPDLGVVLDALRRHAGPSWTPDAAALVRSVLGPAAHHVLLDRLPLGPRTPPGP